MSVPNRQIGWSQESNLLWQILKQLNRLTSVIFALKPKYKVFTALLNQSGSDAPLIIYVGPSYGSTLTIGVSYTIQDNGVTADFTNIGAPNNNVGTSFIATGEVPANRGDDNTYLTYNDGTPKATILENTLGSLSFNFEGDGWYTVNSDNLFTENKTTFSIGILDNNVTIPICSTDFNTNSTNKYKIFTNGTDGTPNNNILVNTYFEIRVYN